MLFLQTAEWEPPDQTMQRQAKLYAWVCILDLSYNTPRDTLHINFTAVCKKKNAYTYNTLW